MKEKYLFLIKFLAIDMFFSVLLQMVLQTFLQQYFDNYLIPMFIIFVAIGLLGIAIWIISGNIKDALAPKKEKKMIQSNKEKIQALQTELLQDFFEIQMTQSFADWKTEVYHVAVAKMNASFSVYREIKEIFDEKSIHNVSVKDLDITALSALMKFDFCAQCCPVQTTRKWISHITGDRNGFSHISNYNDVRKILSLEEVSVKNMRSFLEHLKSINWNYAQKDQFFRKYLGTGNGDGDLVEAEQMVLSERNDESMCSAYIRNYLQDLQFLREERTTSYVGLSYNLQGRNTEKMFLDELIESNIVNSSKGMRIVAEGGYGKSWTLSEIAGRFAAEYLDNSAEGEKPIPVFIELGMLYNDCPSIRKKIAQLVFKGDDDSVTELFKNKTILFLDAMDEVKPELQEDVEREIASLKKSYPDMILVCASRKSAIDKFPITIPCYAIKELDDEQIVEYMNKAISEDIPAREELLDKACKDWIGETRKEFLSNNRTPFYINCYVGLLCETGDNDFVDTTQLVEKFLLSIIKREINKTGFNSDIETFRNFLIELSRLLDAGSESGEKITALPEIDVIRELTDKIIVESGCASVKAVGRKLVEIQILSRDEDNILIMFYHQNYKEYIERKYPVKKYRSWK